MSESASGDADVWGGQTRSGEQSAVTTEAHDKYRQSDYSGTVGTTQRQTTPKKCNADGMCEIQIQYSECLDEYYNQGIITPTTMAITDPSNTYTYTTVCDYALPEQRTVQVDPREEQNVIAWVKDYFSETALPNPTPEMSAPNGGICGVVHTVDLHMPIELRHQERSTPFGALDMHIYGRVEMDWGDRSKNVYTTAGGPYPSAVSHSWTDRGFYDITAKANWTASYTLGPYNGFTYTGVLSGITTTGVVDDFRVWEAQAMLIS